jgi:DNA-binding MarR family transcriptional regulator
VTAQGDGQALEQYPEGVDPLSEIEAAEAAAPAAPDDAPVSSEDILRAIRKLIEHGNAYSKAMSRASGLTVPEVMCLRAAAELPSPQRTVNHLAHHALLSTPTASRILNRLVDAGLLMRERIAGDRRKVFLSLTAQGEAKLTDHLRELQHRFERRFEAMSEEERRTMFRALEQAVDLLRPGPDAT